MKWENSVKSSYCFISFFFTRVSIVHTWLGMRRWFSIRWSAEDMFCVLEFHSKSTATVGEFHETKTMTARSARHAGDLQNLIQTEISVRQSQPVASWYNASSSLSFRQQNVVDWRRVTANFEDSDVDETNSKHSEDVSWLRLMMSKSWGNYMEFLHVKRLRKKMGKFSHSCNLMLS